MAAVAALEAHVEPRSAHMRCTDTTNSPSWRPRPLRTKARTWRCRCHLRPLVGSVAAAMEAVAVGRAVAVVTDRERTARAEAAAAEAAVVRAGSRD